MITAFLRTSSSASSSSMITSSLTQENRQEYDYNVNMDLHKHKQPTVTSCAKNILEFSDGGRKSSTISNSMSRFIVLDNLPFSTVEGDGFLLLLKDICPLYKVPSRNTIKDIVDKKCNEIAFNNPESEPIVSSSELEILKEVIIILKPLEKMTKEVSAEKYITLGKVIPLVHCVQSQYYNLIPKSEICKKMKDNVLREFDRRFGLIEKSFLPSISTLLDPRFKHLLNLNIDESISTGSDSDTGELKKFDLWQHHKKLAHSVVKRKGKGMSMHGETQNEIGNYLSAPVSNLKQDPFETWEEMKYTYSYLYKEAKRYLSVVATSVPSERLFSKAGAIKTKTRNRLHGKRLSRLLFLNSLGPEFWK